MGIESLTQLLQFSPRVATGKRERGMEGSNIQQISGIKSIDHPAEHQRTGFKRVVQSIMLNYVWTDADLVAFMMLYIARQGFTQTED